jgi:hypothetical protein
MPRIKGWRPALFAALDAHRGKPFTWGVHDCAILAADAVLAMTGEDLAAPYRGRYASYTDGRALLAAHGFADQVAIFAAHFAEVPVVRAQVGDLAAVPAGEIGAPGDDLALGVVTGPVIAVMPLRGPGLASVPLLRAVRAFRVE